jgi:hypothetical protein
MKIDPTEQRDKDDGPLCKTCGNGKRWAGIISDADVKARANGDDAEKRRQALGPCYLACHTPIIPHGEAKVIAKRSEAGSRAVQFALSNMCQELDQATKLNIAYSFRGEFKACGKCPRTNYVVQACFMYLSKESDLIELILEELFTPDADEPQNRAAIVRKTAEHKFGCRIILRAVENLSKEQKLKHGIWEALLDTAVDPTHPLNSVVYLCTHNFGNFVMQGILSASTGNDGSSRSRAVPMDKKEELMRIIIKHAITLGEPRSAQAPGSPPSFGQNGAAVLAAAFKQSDVSAKLKKELAYKLVGDQRFFVSMACTRYGHLAAKLVLEAVSREKQMEIVTKLVLQDKASQDESQKECLRVLQASRYGRVLKRYMIEEILGKVGPPPGLEIK